MSMKLLQTYTVAAGGESSVVFTGLPQDGTDLLIKIHARIESPTTAYMAIRFNSTASDYWYQTLYGYGYLGRAGEKFQSTSQILLRTPGGSSGSDFSATNVYVSNYANSSYAKPFTLDNAATDGTRTTAFLMQGDGHWRSNTPITSIQFLEVASQLNQNTTIALYKITKGI